MQQMQQRVGGGSGQTIQSDNAPPSIVLQPTDETYLPPLPSSRIEQILSARAGAKLVQFGYGQFGRGRLVSIPQTGAVQDDYVLGPGDELFVGLRGQENNQFRVTVDRNGQVVVPRIGPVAASGRTFGSFRQDMDAAVHRAYVATDASISVGKMRQISVMVTGEVNAPGQRLVTGLSSAVDALLLSGGVKKTGSMRSIRIQRAGHEYRVDLYSLLTGRGGASTFRLADGDRVVVPPLGKTVAVSGLVRRPGIYELSSGQSSISVNALLQLAGGQEVRGSFRLSVLQIDAQGRSHMLGLSGQSGVVRDSEILFMQLGADQVINQATLSGSTSLAGQYDAGMRLSQVIKAPGALGSSPYTLFGIIVRKDPRTLMRNLVAFTPVAVLSGAEDQQVQSDDLIRPFSVSEISLLTYIVRTYIEKLSIDQAQLHNPLGDDTQTNMASTPQVLASPAAIASNAAKQPVAMDRVNTEPVSKIDELSLSLNDLANASADVQRANIIALLNHRAPGTVADDTAEARRIQQDEGVSEDPSQASNALALRQQQQAVMVQQGSSAQTANYNPNGAGYNSLTSGTANYNPNGAGSNFLTPGQVSPQASPNPASNFQEAPVIQGRFSSNREVKNFGELARQLDIDPLVLINFLIEHRARLDGAVRGPGSYFVGPNVELNDLVQAAGGTVNWANEGGVELITTSVDRQNGRAQTMHLTLPLRENTLSNYIVRPKDTLRFNQIFTDVGVGAITVQGEVRYAGSYPIIRGEHLSDLLARAGGLTNTAYPYGTVFLRKSAAQAEHEGYVRAAAEVQNQLVIAMTRIGNDKIDPSTFAAMQGFVNELRNQKALGRISIAADPSVLASRPELDPLLEAGDVVYIPQHPSNVSVLGQVNQPGSFPYGPGRTVSDYIEMAGGYGAISDESLTFIVLPDGSARRVQKSWLHFDADSLPPGSAIVVPRDVTPLNTRQLILDVSAIFSQFAVSIASLAVLSKQ